MKTLLQRTLTGAIFVAVLLIGLFLGGWIYFSIFLFVLNQALYEITGFIKNENQQIVKPSLAFNLITGSVIYTLSFLNAAGIIPFVPFYVLPGILISVLIFELYRNKENPILNVSFTLFVIIYITIPLSLMNYFAYMPLTDHQYNFEFILSFFLILWTYDTFAYLTGMTIGKHKLFERHSPKKSWEGAIGGAIFAIILSVILSKYFEVLDTWQWVIIALLIAVFGTFGDLSESMFKRSLKIKDSGNLLPGHGGILDRFDAVFLASPAVFIFLEIIKLI